MEFSKPEVKKVESQEERLKNAMDTWPESYYRERDGEIRRQLLAAADALQLTPEENRIRLLLWERRYPELSGVKTNPVKDSYLRAWFDFRYAADNVGHMFSYKKIIREITKDMETMGFNAIKEYGKTGEEMLWREIYHMAMLYIALCREDRTYGSVVLGLGRASDNSVSEKVARELVKVACFVPKELKMEKECSLWTDACVQAYKDMYPSKADYLDLSIAELK